MQIYLPIAEMSLNLWLLLGLGGLTGLLSGMFGVGGGFLTTPFLMFIGVPPAVAVATSANQIVATSFSGFLAHLRLGAVDFKMGGVLLVGGLVGSSLGIVLFGWIKQLGFIDIFVSLTYVVFLGTIGVLMAIESLRSLRAGGRPRAAHSWRERLPYKMHFPHSNISVSVVLPLAIGAFVGVMVSIMGVGGGFFLIPALIYILGMSTANVIGTSLFQIIFITAHVTFLQSVTLQTVDILLALILISSSVIGAQFGSRIGSRLPPEKLRVMLSVIVLLVALRLAYGLFVTPVNPFSVGVE